MSFRPGLGRVALVFSVLLGAAAELEGQGTGFQLFARMGVAMKVNRVSCGVSNDGEVCADANGSSTIGGGYWPKGSPQAYIFNSGMQIAGAIQAGIPGFAWSGDTTGAFFFDPKGTTQHGAKIEMVWNHSDAEDRATWPAEARVPTAGPVSQLYAPELRGRPSASEGDVWTFMWEGDSALMAGRPHPLGIALETRALGWNSPKWNEDIVYFVHTFYNISSACAADYAAYEVPLRDRLVELGRQFQAMNNARFGVTIPQCGYDLHSIYVGNAMDADVSADAGENYGTVNLPLGTGFVYHDLFRGTDGGYRLPADLRGPPFLNGYGFIGMSYLGTPISDTIEGGIRLYSNTTGGGLFNDPRDVRQLWRYFSANINQALGDGGCNNGNPFVTRVCYVKQDGHSDNRIWQSTGPADIPAGGSLSITTAYVFASAVAVPGCPTSPCASVLAGNALRMNDAGLLASGSNLIDSITGFRGFTDDNGDGVVQGREIRTVRGSLLHKVQLARLIFERGFLVPTAPATPDFFLVPGDDQVAILWRPSATETAGDAYFTVANDPASPAYDPNYRQFDTEGYRVYRGRTDDPTKLTLIAQYDYYEEDSQGHPLAMRDYLGAVNPRTNCAPELGRNTIAEGCPINFDQPAQGTPYTAFIEHDIQSDFIQVRLGDRFLDAVGDPYIVAEDTAVTGGGSGHPVLWNQGVPFVHVDSTARNNLRYFYSVVAFDVNSIQSGPSSLESPRVLKSVTPVAPASNYENSGALDLGVFGRGVNMTAALTTAPTIDPITGVFSGPARPATGTSIGFVGQFVAQVVTQSGEMSVRLDSMAPGSAYNNAPSTFWYSVISAAGTVPLTLSVPHDQFNVPNRASGVIDGGPISGERAARYGGSTDYRLAGTFDLTYIGNYYTGAFGRGCVNGAPGFRAAACDYNGARWFDDSVETFPHPTQGNNNNFQNELVTNRTTAGALAGVANVYEARSYHTRPNTYRTVEGVLGTVATAADYRVWWGPGGTVDSVVDITHNVQLPFRADITRGYTWGFLTRGSQATSGVGITDERGTVISVSDFGCVAPLRTYSQSSGHLACTGGPAYLLEDDISDLSDFAPLAFGHTLATDRTITPTTNHGFGMYIAGHIFLFEMNSNAPTAPAAGSLWTMRSYVGSVNGGTGGPNRTGGSFGDYSFTPQPSPFTAVGATLSLRYTVSNTIRSTTRNDLSRVHTIPDPYYLGNAYESSADQRVIKFVNLPDKAIIRIYTLSGILVKVIEHNSSTFGGQADWDVRNAGGRLVASGVYFYHLESPSGARRVGRMTLVTDGR